MAGLAKRATEALPVVSPHETPASQTFFCSGNSDSTSCIREKMFCGMSRRTNLAALICCAARRKAGKNCGPQERGSPMTFFFVFMYTGRVGMRRCNTKSARRRRTAATCKLRVAFLRWPVFAVVLSPRPVWNGAGATASAASRIVCPVTDSITLTCQFFCASVHSQVKKTL